MKKIVPTFEQYFKESKEYSQAEYNRILQGREEEPPTFMLDKIEDYSEFYEKIHNFVKNNLYDTDIDKLPTEILEYYGIEFEPKKDLDDYFLLVDESFLKYIDLKLGRSEFISSFHIHKKINNLDNIREKVEKALTTVDKEVKKLSTMFKTASPTTINNILKEIEILIELTKYAELKVQYLNIEEGDYGFETYKNVLIINSKLTYYYVDLYHKIKPIALKSYKKMYKPIGKGKK